MRIPHLLSYFILLLFPQRLAAQLVFDTIYASPATARGHGVCLAPDNGYLITGYARHLGDPNGDIFAMRIDSLGNVLWERPYGGQGPFNLDDGRKVIATAGGGYAICGTSWTSSHGLNDMSLTRIDEEGNQLWMRTYGGDAQDDAFAIHQCRDGGYLLAGNTASYGSGIFDLFLVKVDSLGDSLWSAVLGSPESDFAYDVTETWDGGALVCGGYSMSSEDKFWLLRFDAFGDTLWTRKHSFPGNIQNRAYSILPLEDTTYIVAGNGMMRIDDRGDTLWTRGDGGGISLGAINSQNFFVLNGGVWTYSIDGRLASSNVPPFDGDQVYGTDMVRAPDGGYLIVGYYLAPDVTHLQVRVTRTNCHGLVEQDSTCMPLPPQPPGIRLFPNPASTTLHVEVAGLTGATLSLHDALGREVQRTTLQEGANEVSTGHLATAVYFYTLRPIDGKPIVGKVIVRQ